MSARYERVRHDDDPDNDDAASSTTPPPQTIQAFSSNFPVPNSPPPSFHSRASSVRRDGTGRHQAVDPALADAFGSDNDSDDDGADADDRQRLVRSRDALRPMRGPRSLNTPSSTMSSSPPAASSTRPAAASTTPAAVATAARSTGRVYGGGIQSDGVFSNITARPEAGEEKEELPPTYEQAAADAAPPYWETTILAPGLGGLDEVYVDGMPVGSVFSFIWNGMISMSFQIVGFLLTYLLHSTHAAKNGSRAGLGITLIQYGFYMKSTNDENSGGSAGAGGGSGAGGMSVAGAAAAGTTSDGFASPPDPNAHNFDPSTVSTGGGSGSGSGLSDLASSEWAAYALMIVGWFILIKAVSDYYKARRHEQLVLQSPDRGLGVAVIAEDEHPEHVV